MLLWNISGSVLENVWCGVHFARSDWYLRNCVNWSVASAEKQTVHVTHPAPSRTAQCSGNSASTGADHLRAGEATAIWHLFGLTEMGQGIVCEVRYHVNKILNVRQSITKTNKNCRPNMYWYVVSLNQVRGCCTAEFTNYLAKVITLERERAGLDQNTPLYSSSLFIWRNHKIATPKTTKDDSSIVRAPHPMTPACFRMDGMAMLPTIDAPVKNFVKFTQLQWQ